MIHGPAAMPFVLVFIFGWACNSHTCSCLSTCSHTESNYHRVFFSRFLCFAVFSLVVCGFVSRDSFRLDWCQRTWRWSANIRYSWRTNETERKKRCFRYCYYCNNGPKHIQKWWVSLSLSVKMYRHNLFGQQQLLSFSRDEHKNARLGGFHEPKRGLLLFGGGNVH